MNTSLIKSIDYKLNSDTCKSENYNMLVKIRRSLLHGIPLTRKQSNILNSEI